MDFGFSEITKNLQDSIMQTITTVVLIGATVAIVGFAAYMAYEYFIAPKLAERKVEALKNATVLSKANPMMGIMGGL